MNKDLAKFIGSRVRAFRKQRCMTQEDLAEAIGKTVETVSNIERGKKLPGLSTLGDIQEVLNVPLSELIDRPSPN